MRRKYSPRRRNAHWWRLGRATFFPVPETYKSLTWRAERLSPSTHLHDTTKKKKSPNAAVWTKPQFAAGASKSTDTFSVIGLAVSLELKAWEKHWADSETTWVCQTRFSASQNSGLEFSVPFRTSESFLWLMELFGTERGSTVLLDYTKLTNPPRNRHNGDVFCVLHKNKHQCFVRKKEPTLVITKTDENN